MLALAVAFALVACGDDTPTVAAPTTAGGRAKAFDSAGDIRTALEAGGVTCEEWRDVGDTDGLCRLSDDDTVVVSFHEDDTERSFFIAISIDKGSAADFYIVGPSWLVGVSGPRALADDVRAVVGGKVETPQQAVS